jgi:hypothetical protein
MFDNEMFQRYLAFVEERHTVWEERQVGAPAPWTSDAILASRKFTNVFRVLDPGSQFIFDLAQDRTPFDHPIDSVFEATPEDFLLRCFLYRHTGRVEAWRHLHFELDCWPTHDNLADVLKVWKEYREAGNPIFTGAYLVYPQSHVPGSDKLEAIVDLTDRLFNGGGTSQQFLRAKTQEDRFSILRRNKGVADFMSMQILTDWGYGPYAAVDRENEFVVPGPGCRKGVAHVTDTRDVVGFLRFAQAEVHASPDCPTLDLDSGPRQPSLMDIQNTWCEFGKYVRYLKAYKVSPPYTPAHPGKQEPPVLPAHWSATTR